MRVVRVPAPETVEGPGGLIGPLLTAQPAPRAGDGRVSRRPALPLIAEKALLPVLGVVAVYAALVPLGPGSGLVPPDLLYCLVVAWVIRRPASAPLGVVLLLGLFGDLMLSRPPGLGALGLLLASEAFRANRRFFHGVPFLVEWLAATAGFAAMLAGIGLALALTLADPPGLAASLRHVLATALAYPLVARRPRLLPAPARAAGGRRRVPGTAAVRRPVKAEAPRITRRALMLLGLQAGVVGALGWRMRDLQILQNEHYRLLAEENRVNIRLIPPARGMIFDRNGKLLAGNRQNYRIIMVREQARDPELVLARLAELIELAAGPAGAGAARDGDAQRLRSGRRRRAPDLGRRGAGRRRTRRCCPASCPRSASAATIPTARAPCTCSATSARCRRADLAKLEDPDPLLQIPRFQIGKTGVEAKLEPELRGEAGTLKIEVSAAGRVMRELGRVEGTPGKDVQLTLDLDLQAYALQRMAGQSAAAAVIDITNGDIVALASAPAFDPNSFVFGIKSGEWNTLLNDEYRPLTNKTVTGTYPPGSTFKICMALAALEAGAVSPGDGVYCAGGTYLGRRRFHCWKPGGHGTVAMRRSLAQSCDCYYYEMGRRLGPDAISAMAHRLGLGVRHELPMPAVSEGNMPDAAWKQANRGESWTAGDSFNYGIGQGFTLASPLQLAVMVARLASGTAIKPRLIRSVSGVPAPVETPEPLGIAPGAPADGPRRHVRGLQRRRHRLAVAHRRPGDADGGQDRHQPGAHHHRRRARRRRHQERAAALAPPRPRAVRRLRALRQPALRHRPGRRARRRRLGGRRRRSPATSCSTRSAAACRRSRPIPRSSARRSRSSARCRPAAGQEAAPAAPARDRA